MFIHGFQGQTGGKVKVDIRCHFLHPSSSSDVQDAVSSAHSCVVACAELTLRCQFPMGKKQQPEQTINCITPASSQADRVAVLTSALQTVTYIKGKVAS